MKKLLLLLFFCIPTLVFARQKETPVPPVESPEFCEYIFEMLGYRVGSSNSVLCHLEDFDQCLNPVLQKIKHSKKFGLLRYLKHLKSVDTVLLGQILFLHEIRTSERDLIRRNHPGTFGKYMMKAAHLFDRITMFDENDPVEEKFEKVVARLDRCKKCLESPEVRAAIEQYRAKNGIRPRVA